MWLNVPEHNVDGVALSSALYRTLLLGLQTHPDPHARELLKFLPEAPPAGVQS